MLVGARELLCIMVDNIVCTLHVLFEFRISILSGGVLDVPYETHPPPLYVPLFFRMCTIHVVVLIVHLLCLDLHVYTISV